MSLPVDYVQLLADVKRRIQTAQVRAAFAANSELIRLYWQVGQLLDRRQAEEGWGAAVIPRLARDLANELPEVKGFSERNLKRMLSFFRAYADEPAFLTDEPAEKVPPLVAQMADAEKMPQPVAPTHGSTQLRFLPWGHHVLLLEKVKRREQRLSARTGYPTE